MSLSQPDSQSVSILEEHKKELQTPLVDEDDLKVFGSNSSLECPVCY